jgi:hypothetical protein
MRAPSKDPAARPRPDQRQSEPSSQRARKKPQSVKPNANNDLALNDETTDAAAVDSLETLPELEREIGIADWIDPQTGEPAEGQSPPHIHDD